MEKNRFPHARRSGRYCAQPRQIPVRGEKRRLFGIQNIRLQYRNAPAIPRRHQRLPFSDFHDGYQKLVRPCQPRAVMEPFNPFLAPCCKFSWSPALEEAFQLSKEAIILAIHQVKIFGDRTLDEITNSRLFRLKQRTLQVGASTSPYLPVKSNHGADVTSRHPSPSGSANSTPLERPASLIKWSRHSWRLPSVTLRNWVPSHGPSLHKRQLRTPL